MENRFIRLSSIVSTKHKRGLLPVSAATIWRWVGSGKFPKPFKMGPSITVWNAHEINEFIARCAGDTQ